MPNEKKGIHIKSSKDIEGLLEGIRLPQYGTITIVIHEGKVVQIETNEKYRL